MEKKDAPSFGKTVKEVEKKVAKELIRWRLRRGGLPAVSEEMLDRGTERLIDEAHRIVKGRGRSILNELKQAKREFHKSCRGEDEEGT